MMKEQKGTHHMGPREQQMYSQQPGNVYPGEKIQPTRRRRGRLWLWLVIVLAIVALLGMGVNAALSNASTTTETHRYTVSSSASPQLVLNDDSGSITIHRGSPN